MPPRRFDFYWARYARWCWLGTFVMLVWLMVPVARCSYRWFRDTPLAAVDDETPGQADKDRVHKGEDFASGFVGSVKRCYSKTPLLDQDWKSTLLIAFAIGGVAFTLVDRVLAGRRKTTT